MPRLSTYTDIARPAKTVFSILRDVEAYASRFQYVRSASILHDADDSLSAEIQEEIYGVRQRVLAHFQFFPPSRIIVEQIEGPFASATAEFRLEPRNEETRLHHTIQFEIRTGFGGGLLRRAIAGRVVDARMNEEVAAIKRAAEQTAPSGDNVSNRANTRDY